MILLNITGTIKLESLMIDRSFHTPRSAKETAKLNMITRFIDHLSTAVVYLTVDKWFVWVFLRFLYFFQIRIDYWY